MGVYPQQRLVRQGVTVPEEVEQPVQPNPATIGGQVYATIQEYPLANGEDRRGTMLTIGF